MGINSLTYTFYTFNSKLLHTLAARTYLVPTCNSKSQSASDLTPRCCSRCNRFGSCRRCSNVRTSRNVYGKPGNSRSSSITSGGPPCISSISASRTRYAGRIRCGSFSTWLSSLTQGTHHRFPKRHRLPIRSPVVSPTSRFSFRPPSALRPHQLDLSPLQWIHPSST